MNNIAFTGFDIFSLKEWGQSEKRLDQAVKTINW